MITDIIFGKTQYLNLPEVDMWISVDILYRKTVNRYTYSSSGDLETVTKVTTHSPSRFKHIESNVWEDVVWDFNNCEYIKHNRDSHCNVYNVSINQDDVDYWESMGFVVLSKLEVDPYKDANVIHYDSNGYLTIDHITNNATGVTFSNISGIVIGNSTIDFSKYRSKEDSND
jgi:hypothetical protein